MIYLIRLYGKGDRTGLKIGYTADENLDIRSNRRLSTYIYHSLDVELIHTIPGATEKQEKKLHYKFKDSILERNEVFKDIPEIVNYIKSVTLDDLEKLPDLEISSTELKILRKTVRISFDLTRKRDKVMYSSIYESEYKNLIEKLKLPADKLPKSSYYSIQDVYRIFKLTEEEVGLCERLIKKDYTELSKNIVDFIEKYNSDSKEFTDRMKLLCDFGFTSEELEIVFKQIPTEYAKYYYALGPEKIKSWSFRKYQLQTEYEKLFVNNDEERFKNLIYEKFEIDKKYSLQEIKLELSNIYKELSNDSTPKATILNEYFEIKKCKISNGNNRIDGYKLIKKLK